MIFSSRCMSCLHGAWPKIVIKFNTGTCVECGITGSQHHLVEKKNPNINSHTHCEGGEGHAHAPEPVQRQSKEDQD